MAEYIERDKLGVDFELCNKQNPRWTPQRVASLIARANAADVVPLVHGRWEAYPSDAFMRCSVCKCEYQRIKMPQVVGWCPNPECGARMDGADVQNT